MNLLQRPEIVGSIIGGAVALAIACSQLVAGLVDRHQIRKALLRDIRHAPYSFRIALFPAADRGMADPEKWFGIVARISDLQTPPNTRYLRDLEAGALSSFVLESVRAVTDLRAAAERAKKKLAKEPPPEQHEGTAAAAAMEGVPWDPRTFDFRWEVKKIARPLYDHLTATRIAFGDYSALLLDQVEMLYGASSWRVRRTLWKLYEPQLRGHHRPWGQRPRRPA